MADNWQGEKKRDKVGRSGSRKRELLYTENHALDAGFSGTIKDPPKLIGGSFL